MSRALVTGAAGFIGSHLCERLVADAWTVTGVDSFTDYYSPARKRSHLAGLAGDGRFTLVEADLCSCDIGALVDGADTVFHLAAQAGVRRSWGDEFRHYVESNIVATQRLLEAMKGREIPLVYSSSSSVYGDTRTLPMREDHPTAPVSPYGATKLWGEDLCDLYRVNYGLRYTALRYFTVFGPRQRPDMAFSIFISAALAGGPVDVFGDGRQTRDFTYVSDAVEANLLAASYRGEQRIFNIGGGSRCSILDVIDVIRRLTGAALPLRLHERARGDVLDTWADTARAAGELGFAPATGLEDGIAREIEWYRDHPGDGAGR
jgi:UDP-glucose 4-epimerase